MVCWMRKNRVNVTEQKCGTKSKRVTLPFWQVLSDVTHSCLMFKIFNLSALNLVQ